MIKKTSQENFGKINLEINILSGIQDILKELI